MVKCRLLPPPRATVGHSRRPLSAAPATMMGTSMTKQKTTVADGAERAHSRHGRLRHLYRLTGLGAAAGAMVIVPALAGVFPAAGRGPRPSVKPVKPHVVKAGFVPDALSGVLADGRQKLGAGEKDPRAGAHAAARTQAQDVPGPVGVVGVSWPKGAVTSR